MTELICFYISNKPNLAGLFNKAIRSVQQSQIPLSSESRGSKNLRGFLTSVSQILLDFLKNLYYYSFREVFLTIYYSYYNGTDKLTGDSQGGKVFLVYYLSQFNINKIW